MAKGKRLLWTYYNAGKSWECPDCRHQNWKWQEKCAKCGYQERITQCISCGRLVGDDEWCPEPCNTDLRDSNNRV